jgi:hypothetical protein
MALANAPTWPSLRAPLLLCPGINPNITGILEELEDSLQGCSILDSEPVSQAQPGVILVSAGLKIIPWQIFKNFLLI